MHGILLLDKPRDKTSFYLVGRLRRIFNEKKIGHAGTLDPFATGVMVMLIGKTYTRLSDSFLGEGKEYIAQAKLGISTDSYDCDGAIVSETPSIPTLEIVQTVLSHFQGEILQIPPMFSAKKIGGKKLYELARQGKTIERLPVKIHLQTSLISYNYPFLEFSVSCSKGTYIRSVAHEIGEMLGCGAHLTQLQRVRSGNFHLKDCLNLDYLSCPEFDISQLQRDSRGVLILNR
jgi:tRNA pseudouridine55 synthase